MNFDTACEAHSWPEPKDGWCPICIMNEADDVKRQRDQLAEALRDIEVMPGDRLDECIVVARAAPQQLDEE